MPTTVLESVREQRTTLESEIDALISADDFDPADETFTRAKAAAENLDAKIKALVENETRRAAANEIDALSLRTLKTAKTKREAESEHRSMGEAFIRSKAYSDYLAAPRGTSGHVHFDSDRLFRAPITSEDFGGLTGGVYRPAQLPPVVERDPATPLLDLIPRVPVGSGAVEWVVYPPAPEAGRVPEGAIKPEATVAPTVANVTLDIIAHWLQVTRTVMEDQPALMRYIDSALRRGVIQKMESEAATEVTGASLPPTEYPNGGTLLEGIRLGIATVQEAGYAPTAVLLNPADYAGLDIGLLGQTVVNTGTGPQIGQTYWGVRPIPSSAVTPGTAVLGDFGTAAVTLMRSQISTYLTDSHASTFTSNLLTLLTETRAKTVVQQPNALTEISEAPVKKRTTRPAKKKTAGEDTGEDTGEDA